MKAASCAVWLLLSACVRTVPLPDRALVQRATTDDGWELELVRYDAQGPVTGRPVLLCHGISANARNMDLDEGHSLARWLSAHGRQAWTLSLRGTGSSSRVDVRLGRGPISFDDYWRHDLPAAIRHVLAQSGAPQLDYIGHSMGGMVLYAYLSQGGQGVAAAATLGSPTRLDWGTVLDRVLAQAAPPLLPKSGALPSAFGSAVAAPFQGGVADDFFERLFYRRESTRVASWQRLMAYGTADTSGPVARHFLQLASSGRFLSADGRLDLRADMGRATTPLLVVAGAFDRIALTPAVKDGFRAWAGPKAWALISKANGAQAEYGHMDLVIGEHAAEDVWTPVLDFLRAHSTALTHP